MSRQHLRGRMYLPPARPEPVEPVWGAAVGWVLVLVAMMLTVVGWDQVVNGVELLAFVSAVLGFTLLIGRAAQ